MAINRISDLSILHSDDVIKDGQLVDNFKDSFMEISYRTDESEFKMKSMAMRVNDLVDSCATAIFQNPRDIHISGSVYANENGSALNKNAYLNFQTFNISAQSGMNVNGPAAFNDRINISPSGTVQTTTDIGNSIVNVQYMNNAITNMAQSIKNDLSDYIARIIGEKLALQQYTVEMPILSYIYSDHNLTGLEQWKKAGDTVVLSDYPALSSHYMLNKDSMRIGSPSTEDTWYYQERKSGSQVTALVLPKTEWFIQPTASVSKSNQFMQESLPKLSASVAHSHMFPKYTLSTGCASGNNVSCVSSFMQPGLTDPYSGEIIIKNTIYNGNHVQPYSTRAMLYFYVGPKAGKEIPVISVDYEKVWPVGSVYIATSDTPTCPLASLMPNAQWHRIQGRYLLASGNLIGGNASESYTPGMNVDAGLPDFSVTGGGATYSFNNGVADGGGSPPTCVIHSASTCSSGITVSKPDVYGKSNTVRPPAIALAVWKRTR